MTKANLFADANADGVADSMTPTAVVDGSDVKSLWEAGLMLWNTSASHARTIYANVTDTFAATTTAFAGMTEFSSSEYWHHVHAPELAEYKCHRAGVRH